MVDPRATKSGSLAPHDNAAVPEVDCLGNGVLSSLQQHSAPESVIVKRHRAHAINRFLNVLCIIIPRWRDRSPDRYVRDRDAATLIASVGKVTNLIAVFIRSVNQSPVCPRGNE